MSKRVTISAEVWSQRWVQGVQNSSEKVQSGVQAVTEAPGQKAADKADLWLAKLQASKDKFKRNVAAVSLEDWKSRFITKGIPAMQTAAPLSKTKVAKKAGELIPVINDALASMPERGATLDANLARVRHMASALQKAFA